MTNNTEYYVTFYQVWFMIIKNVYVKDALMAISSAVCYGSELQYLSITQDDK